ncbi:xylose isomerase [Halosimplex carlsbadense 2-9-1]|uniref:Xylose isomerase n=1 Tax=Halosimplex carlsbadense 2-9-1 TaxID=797114 RepID=M0D1D5_9EURY|nr:sugar phosphate isomerase/epimerase [Halosimplex carlsbadense]ELZ29255.1 xylose isomerase [Halosimplex carlsbadense 2-9-1]
MTRSAVQLYTLRNVDRPFTEVLELVADAGFEGVEFAYRVTEADTDEVLATLDETGLDVAGAHVGIDELEDDFEETVAYYDDLGVEHVVVPWLDAEHFESVAAVEAAAARLTELADELAAHGMTLHYHNHDHEYTDLGDRTGFDAFVDETAFPIELDLGLALAAGDDVVERLRDLGDRSRLVHLKDYDVAGGESVPVGEGDLDLDGVADAVADNDSEWLIYEYEGADPLDSLERAAERTNELV